MSVKILSSEFQNSNFDDLPQHYVLHYIFLFWQSFLFATVMLTTKFRGGSRLETIDGFHLRDKAAPY